MKIIVNTVPLKKVNLQKIIPIFNRLNFNDIELHFDHFFSNDYDLNDIINLFEENQIKVRAMAGGWCDFFYDGKIKKETFNSIERQISLMKNFNCNKLRLFFGRLPINEFNSKARKILIRNLQELSDKFSGNNFIFETHDNISVDYKILKPILEEVNRNNINLNFDPANIRKAGFDPYDFLIEMRNKIKHLHVKGLKSLTGKTIKDFYCSYGEGILSYKKIFDYLKETNYQDCLSIEFEGNGYPILEIFNAKLKLEEDLK